MKITIDTASPHTSPSEPRERAGARIATLVIVHLSSLDSYVATYGRAAGYSLAHRLAEAIKVADRCVVTDQGWPVSENSGPRLKIESSLEVHPRVIRFTHDEATDGWDEPMPRLAADLGALKGDPILMGGPGSEPLTSTAAFPRRPRLCVPTATR